MKLIIEIDKSYFEIIKHDFEHGSNYKPFEIIANGKLYEVRPKDELISRQEAIDVLEEQLDYLQKLNKNENPTAESKWYGVNWAKNTIANLPYKQNERPNNNFTRKELESWLYQIAFNNTDNELSKNCEEIIKRLDGFERFCADMRGT